MFNEKLILTVESMNLDNAVTQVSNDLSMSKGSVSSYLNGKIRASKSFLQKFANFYKIDIENITDLKSETDKEVLQTEPQQEATGYYYPNVTASAGLGFLTNNSDTEKIAVYMPTLDKDLNFINIIGDSMYPKYCGGEIIGIKETEPQYVIYGYAHVIILNNGEIYIKYIHQGKNDDHWLLKSENTFYPEQEFHKSLIHKIFKIKAVITKTTM